MDVVVIDAGAPRATRQPKVVNGKAPVRAAVQKLLVAAQSYLSRGNAALAKDWSEF